MTHLIARIAFGLVLAGGIGSAAAAQVCPEGPDLSGRRGDLMETLRLAPDALSAQLITNDLWGVWATAPDAHAQELLDEGMQRRAVFDLDAAIVAFDALIAYCPDYAEGYNQRAFALFIQQKFALSLADLDRALERRPDHIGALTGRAMALISLGRNAEAQAELRRALVLNPWLPERRFLTEDAGGEDQEL